MIKCVCTAVRHSNLVASGADAYLLPIVVRTDSFGCDIMISASYNPCYNNGIKLINDNGKKTEKSVL